MFEKEGFRRPVTPTETDFQSRGESMRLLSNLPEQNCEGKITCNDKEIILISKSTR